MHSRGACFGSFFLRSEIQRYSTDSSRFAPAAFKTAWKYRNVSHATLAPFSLREEPTSNATHDRHLLKTPRTRHHRVQPTCNASFRPWCMHVDEQRPLPLAGAAICCACTSAQHRKCSHTAWSMTTVTNPSRCTAAMRTKLLQGP